MKIAVGCPVFERAWVLDRWFDSVEAQEFDGDVEYHFVVTRGDDESIDIILRRAAWRLRACVIDGEPGFRNEQRTDRARYTRLADLRNKLLVSVRDSRPDFFLSWDSDLLFGPRVLRSLFDVDKPLVGALVDMLGEDWLMREGHGFPSYMSLLGDTADRSEEPLPTEPTRVGVVMGTVLMRPEVYEQVEYAYHIQGEDIAFAIACERAGFERWLQPAAHGEHLHDEVAAA